MRNNPDSHEFLAVVAPVHHQRVCEAFNDWALCLPKAFDSIAAGGVRDVDWGANLNVIPISRALLSQIFAKPCAPRVVQSRRSSLACQFRKYKGRRDIQDMAWISSQLHETFRIQGNPQGLHSRQGNITNFDILV